MKSFYVSTPIYYVNDRPHMGHAYASVHADAIARLRHMANYDTYFLTGADEHGEKIAKAAALAGESIQEFVDNNARHFQEAWQRLNVTPTRFVRTTETAHKEFVQRMLQKLYDKGEIYKAEYEGLYSIGQERFVTVKELVDGKLPEDKDPPQLRKEINYFFRMEKHREWMREYISTNQDMIVPSQFANEILQLLSEPIGDLSISRPVSRLSWGISIPWDVEHVVYVWFDALLSYISPLINEDSNDFEKFWPASHHIIGKDILRTHTLFWLSMCRAMDIAPYAKLYVSGHLLGFDGRKMSKSLGNGIDPLAAAAQFGTDVLRYVLIKEVKFGSDGVISKEIIEQRLSNDLANDIGNLASRSIAMINKYRDGVVPETTPKSERGLNLYEKAAGIFPKILELADALKLSQAFELVLDFARDLNKYVSESQPWVLAKFSEKEEELNEVLFILHYGLHSISLLMSPVMPEKMVALREALGVGHESLRWHAPNVTGTYKVAPSPSPLFPKITAESI